MIDVNEITSTLRSMPDQQLQQYAMMHKGDPYILSLAVSESNQRKKMRMAAQGQAAGQPMPKVVDQDIAAMAPQQLPENQGIARIPAPNIQGMADGGIAGYGDDANEGYAVGGSMFDFAQRSEPVLRMAGGGEVPRYQGNATYGSLVGDIPGFQAVQPRAQFTQQGAPESTPFFQRVVESLGSGNKDRQLAAIEQKIAQGIASAEEKAFYQAEMGKRAGQPQMGAPKDVVNPDEILMAAEKAKKPGAAAADKAATDKTPPAAPAPQGNLPTGGLSTKAAQDLGSKFYDLKGATNRIEQQLAQERQDITNEKEARAEKLAAFNKEQGPAMAGYEKLLKSEEMQDATDKEKAGLMALFKGFLGMAAGESPNAAVNIAKGAMVGLGDYSDTLKELKKSAKERNKAMAEIENARRLEAKGDLKDSQAAEDKANDYLRASQRHGIDAIMNATGKSAEISAGIYKSILDNTGAMARTQLQVGAPSGIEKIVQRMQTDPKFAAAYKDYASIGPEAKGIAGIAAKMVGNPTAMMLLKQEDPDLHAQVSAYIKQMSLTPTSKPTGQVLVGQ